MIFDIISKAVRSCNIRKLAILLNGEFLTFNRKLVYVSAVDGEGDNTLSFFVESKDSVTGSSIQKFVNPVFSTISSTLLSKELFGVSVSGEPSPEGCKISVCSNMRLLVLESHLYAAIRMIVESDQKNKSFIFGHQIVPEEIITRLRTAFVRNSYLRYGELVYSANVSRFTSKLIKANKFYSVQRAFIPVFIDYEKSYNPFRADNSVVKQTKLYNVAVQKGRKVEVDNLSGYLLTHLEICQALGMKHFMRFTPAFLYRLFVGLLFPGYEEFPGKSSGNGRHEVFVRPNTLDTNHLRNVVITKEEAARIVQKNDQILQNSESGDDAKRIAKETIAEMQMYRIVDSLYAACLSYYSQLTNIGSSMLDSKEQTTLDKIYSYASEASIVYGR